MSIFGRIYTVLILLNIVSNIYLAFAEQDYIAGQNILLWLILLQLNILIERKMKE